MSERTTLVKPPPLDPSKSAIENVLELTELSAIGPDMFTNTRPLWHPPGARGIYGGAVIAQCLAAAQRTVPSTFTVHSMHCYFVLAGDATIPVMYYVEHVREGKSFATRTVQARQRGKAIFTTTMSFVRENSGGKKTVEHAVPLPGNIVPPESSPSMDEEEGTGPFQSRRIEILNKESSNPHEKRTRQWIKARGRISEAGGHQAHLSALAYMSDSYFIGTVSRVHDLWRFGAPANEKKPGEDSAASEMKIREKYLRRLKESEGLEPDAENHEGRPEIGMMVSLDHSIYFHEPRKFRADEWMFTEMHSPWSGSGRGVVTQHMFAGDGTLIATCFQEGVVRLKEERVPVPKASKL
ncbi:acyl-CoA thioesteras-like protein II [Halenospora varia]|nr:acyl-CoA thioesteras-like protein II [Halenospora varia]